MNRPARTSAGYRRGKPLGLALLLGVAAVAAPAEAGVTAAAEQQLRQRVAAAPLTTGRAPHLVQAQAGSGRAAAPQQQAPWGARPQPPRSGYPSQPGGQPQHQQTYPPGNWQQPPRNWQQPPRHWQPNPPGNWQPPPPSGWQQQPPGNWQPHSPPGLDPGPGGFANPPRDYPTPPRQYPSPLRPWPPNGRH